MIEGISQFLGMRLLGGIAMIGLSKVVGLWWPEEKIRAALSIQLDPAANSGRAINLRSGDPFPVLTVYASVANRTPFRFLLHSWTLVLLDVTRPLVVVTQADPVEIGVDQTRTLFARRYLYREESDLLRDVCAGKEECPLSAELTTSFVGPFGVLRMVRLFEREYVAIQGVW